MKSDYFGHSCFRVTAENGTSWVCDPYTQVGYELLANLQADIVTVSHGHFDHNYVAGVQGVQRVFTSGNNFSFNGLVGYAIKSYHDDRKGALRGENLIFKVDIDGVTFCHLGDLGEPCSAALIGNIGKVHVLMLPVGGTYTIDSAQAKAYVDALQPNVIIPMHYKPLDGTINITDASAFLNAFDKQNVENAGKEIIITTKEIAQSNKKILYMEK